MKLPVILSLCVAATVGASHAGSFGGPGPFSDLSPLQSGIDGSYQAVARGVNLTGVIRFAYQGGVQSNRPQANAYNFFVAGDVVNGGVTAAINGKDLAGVLGGQDFTVPESDDGSTELPLVFIVRGNRASGEFNGHLDLEDRMSVFSGEGLIAPANSESNTVIGINEGNNGGIDVIVDGFEIDGSDIVSTEFTFNGVRTSVIAQSVGGNTTTTTSSQ